MLEPEDLAWFQAEVGSAKNPAHLRVSHHDRYECGTRELEPLHCSIIDTSVTLTPGDHIGPMVLMAISLGTGVTCFDVFSGQSLPMSKVMFDKKG